MYIKKLHSSLLSKSLSMTPVKYIDLSEVNYLLHDFDVNNNDDVEFDGIRVVTLGAQTPEILKVHSFYYYEDTPDDNQLERIMAHFTEIRTIARFNCKILTETSHQNVCCKKEAINILKGGRNIYGVWGKKQYDLFSRFSLRVVDISESILDEMINRRGEDLPRKTRFDYCNNMDLSQVSLHLKPKEPIALFFQRLLTGRLVDFEHVSEESFEKVFEKWVKNKAWFSMVNAM